MFKRKTKPNKKQTTAATTTTSSSPTKVVDKISLLVSPDDIPVLYHSMKSIVDKLEPMMEQSNILIKGVDKKAAHDTAGLVSNVVSSVMVDTTGLESNLFNYLVDENEEPFDYGVPGGGLDLNIAVTSKLRDNKKGATEIIDLNQEIPFQNENNCIKEATASCEQEIEQVDTQEEVVTAPTTTTTADHQTTETKTKECDNSIPKPLPISNTALASLLYEYQLEAYESPSSNQEESCTSSKSIKQEGSNNNNNKQHENQRSTAAPPQKDDYLTSIIEEYSPFYNFPTDDETSEVERTYYNPYKIVFAGEF